jgi:hypothetical protein
VEFDIFISHASEDKNFVGPLATVLRDRGYKTWYDEFVLRVGDSLTERIDYGLANSAAGILVLSPSFIAKPWPRTELAGLRARHLANATRLIPIWHNIRADDLLKFSPPLADIKALQSSAGLESIVRDLSAVVKPSDPTKSDLTIESAEEMINAGDYDLAMKTAFVAFDRRVIGLVDHLRDSGGLPVEFRIGQYPGAAWEAVAKLKELGKLTTPPEVDLGFLEHAMGITVGRWSHALHMPLQPEEAIEVVSQIGRMLRTNPIES